MMLSFSGNLASMSSVVGVSSLSHVNPVNPIASSIFIIRVFFRAEVIHISMTVYKKQTWGSDAVVQGISVLVAEL
jgi:hypothetical protein